MRNFSATDNKVLLMLRTWNACKLFAPDVELQHALEELSTSLSTSWLCPFPEPPPRPKLAARWALLFKKQLPTVFQKHQACSAQKLFSEGCTSVSDCRAVSDCKGESLWFAHQSHLRRLRKTTVPGCLKDWAEEAAGMQTSMNMYTSTRGVGTTEKVFSSDSQWSRTAFQCRR